MPQTPVVRRYAVGRRGYRFVGQLEPTDFLSVDSNGGRGEASFPSFQPPAQGELRKPAPSEPTRSRTRRLIFLSFAGFVILLSVIAVPKFGHIRSGIQQSLTRHSLAILPLHNSGQDSSSDFLGFSLADVLITKLAYVSSLSVRPSAVVEKYRGTTIDLQKVAADLKVDTLLTGSFIRDGDNLRITYQLLDAKTEKILGQGIIDLKYDNLLAVQDTVTSQLITELQLSLSPSEAQRLNAVDTLSFHASSSAFFGARRGVMLDFADQLGRQVSQCASMLAVERECWMPQASSRKGPRGNHTVLR